MIKNKKNLIFFSAVSFVFFFCFTLDALAASLFTQNPGSVSLGETVEVVVMIDTDKEPINSVELEIKYNKNTLTFAGYKTPNTVLKTWLQPPKDFSGVVKFTGIIPGGVSTVFDPRREKDNPLPLVRLIFKTKSKGESDFEFIKSDILKNDGLGSELPHESLTGKVVVLEKWLPSEESNVVVEEEKVTDLEPPLPFEILFIKSSFFSRTPSMIAFETTDESSGIMKYEIELNNKEWQEVVSPYPVPKSLFSQVIKIKATDFEGNSRVSSIDTVGFIDGNLRLSVGAISLLALLLFVFLVYKLHKTRKKV